MEYINRKEFNGSVIKEQYRFCETLYLITYLDGKYKLIQVDSDNPRGKQIGVSKNVTELHKRIPDYD